MGNYESPEIAVVGNVVDQTEGKAMVAVMAVVVEVIVAANQGLWINFTTWLGHSEELQE